MKTTNKINWYLKRLNVNNYIFDGNFLIIPDAYLFEIEIISKDLKLQFSKINDYYITTIK